MTKNLLIFAFLFIAAAPARAWRETGHYTVCELAFRRLTPENKRAVAELLDGADFAEQCTWPDTVRKSPRWKHTYDWHFINIDDGEGYPEVINPKGDVVQALIKMEDALRDPATKREDRVAALKFLAHFSGDLHQPLHVGRKTDLGGNNVKVSWFGQAEYPYEEILHDGVFRRVEPFNLHKVWDLHMLERFIAERGLEDGTRYKHRAYADHLEQAASTATVSALVGATYLDWALESLELRRVAYQFIGKELGQAYYEARMPVVNARLLAAGIRLGDLLNRVLSGAPMRPQDAAARERIRKALERR